MKTILWILASWLWVAGLAARETPRSVSGSVAGESGETLPYAHIVVKGTPYGTASDPEGNYRLQMPASGTYRLVVQYAGFVPFEQQIYLGGDTVIHFRLKEDALKLNEVTVTATRTPKLLADAPVITRVITAGEISRVNAATVQDLLETELPGLEFTREMDGQTAIRMQGMSGKYVLFLVDGERMAGETLNNVDYNRLNAENIERIEIVKGAASALYGSNAIGGVVNIITKEAVKPWSVNVNGHFGNLHEKANGYDQRYGTTIGLKQGKVGSFTSASYKKKGTYVLRDKDGAETPVNGGWDLSVNEKLSWQVADRIMLTGKGSFYTRRVDNYQAKVKDRYLNFNGNLRMNYRLSEKQNLEVSYLVDRYNKYDRYVVKQVDTLNYRNTQQTARAQYTYTFKPGNTLTGGAEFFRDALMSYQFGGDTHAIDDYILYAQHDIALAKPLTLVYGARMDAYSSFGVHFSPSLSLMYKWNPLTFRASYARGFRAPSLKEMWTDWDMGGMGWFIVFGNPGLQPEVSDNFTLSAEYARDRVNLSVVGYYNKISDKIATVYNADRDTSFYTNIDQSSLAGLDANLAVKCPYGFTVKMAYAYVHEKMEQNGVNVSSTRPHSATLGLNYEHAWKDYSLNVAVNGRFLSKLDTHEANDDDTYAPVHYPGYQHWKLTVSGRLFRAYLLQLTVDNVFNYRPDHYSFNSPVSPGRTFMAGLSVNLDELF